MCRQTSVLNKVSFVILVFGFLACALSFSAPFWVRMPDTMSLLWSKEVYKGLWASCCPNSEETAGVSCHGIWEDYAYDSMVPPCSWVQNKFFDTFSSQASDMPPWLKAAEILFCVALGFLFVGLFLQCIYSCCRCCKNPTWFPSVVASATLGGAILVGLSLGIYGGFSYQEKVFAPALSGGKSGILYWAFYVGIAGACTCFIVAILLYIDGCIHSRNYRGYKTTNAANQ